MDIDTIRRHATANPASASPTMATALCDEVDRLNDLSLAKDEHLAVLMDLIDDLTAESVAKDKAMHALAERIEQVTAELEALTAAVEVPA